MNWSESIQTVSPESQFLVSGSCYQQETDVTHRERDHYLTTERGFHDEREIRHSREITLKLHRNKLIQLNVCGFRSIYITAHAHKCRSYRRSWRVSPCRTTAVQDGFNLCKSHTAGYFFRTHQEVSSCVVATESGLFRWNINVFLGLNLTRKKPKWIL